MERWLSHFMYLGFLTALVGLMQAAAGTLLWTRTASPLLLAYGLDALVGAMRELGVARRIALVGSADTEARGDRWIFRTIAGAYLAVGAVSLAMGLVFLFGARRPTPSFLGVVLAAVSMLLIPIIGSYMKSLAMEVRSDALKAAAVFTFGNSYLSLVLLIGLLVNLGMQHWWGDAVGAVVMSPFIIQKGLGMLAEGRDTAFVEE